MEKTLEKEEVCDSQNERSKADLEEFLVIRNDRIQVKPRTEQQKDNFSNTWESFVSTARNNF